MLTWQSEKGFATSAISIVDNFMLTASEWMKHNQNTIAVINHRAIWIKFCNHFWLFCQLVKKNWPLLRGYFGSWGHSLVAVATVERWPLLRGLNKSQCMNSPPQKSSHCRDVAVSRGLTIAYLTCNGPLLPTIWTVFTQLFLSTSMACSHMSVFWIIRKQKIKELYDDNLNRHGSRLLRPNSQNFFRLGAKEKGIITWKKNMHLSVCQFDCSTDCLSVCRSVGLSVCTSDWLSIFVSLCLCI